MVLGSYYVIKPVRDDIGAHNGVQNLWWMFTGTLLVALVANTAFSAIVARMSRRRFIPIAYRFFILNLAIFYVAMRLPEQHCTVLGRDSFFRLGQRRLQPFHPYRLLGVHVGCIQPRPRQTPVRVHQRGRRAWRHRRCVSRRSAGERNRCRQFAHHFGDHARGGSVVRAIFSCRFRALVILSEARRAMTKPPKGRSAAES